MTKRLLLLVAVPAALVPAAWSVAKTSHEGWPRINGDLKMHSNDESGTLRATKLRKHNELLGGHGNDTLRAGKIGDVLWGDYKPGGQPTSQTDRIYGGGGKDFIYTHHRADLVPPGGGADPIHAPLRHGGMWGGGGDGTPFLPPKTRKRPKTPTRARR